MMKLETLCETIRRELSRFRADQNGATAIEYAMIAAGVMSLGSHLKTTFYDKLAGML